MNKRRRTQLRIDALEDRAVPATLSNYLTDEHTDLNLSFTGGPSGTWSLNPRDAAAVISYPPDDVVLYVGTNSESTRPAGTEFDFIGVNSGDAFYKLPATQNPTLLFLGTAGYGIAAGSLDRYDPETESKGRVSGVGRWAKVTLLDVQGPGTFSMWQSGDTTPDVFISDYDNSISDPDGNGIDSTDGIAADDALWVVAGGHTHYNMGFGALGRYEVTVKLSGYLDDANTSSLGTYTESGPFTFYLSVGNVGQLEFDASSYQVNENAGTASITVHRVNGSDGRLTVDYATSNGTAGASDYTPTSGALTFEDLETVKTINIPLTNDSSDEADETVNLTLSNAGPSTFGDYLFDAEGRTLLGSNTAAVLSIVNDDSPGGNTPPNISDVLDQNTDEDINTGPIAVTVGDTESALDDLLLTATSSDQALVPNANIVVGGSGANRTVSITPAANLSGTVTITLVVKDTGTLTATDSFDLIVDPVNDAPVADDQTISTPQETSLPITLTGSDIENSPLDYMVVDLPAHGNLTGNGASRTYDPALGFTGTDSFTFRVDDGGLDSPLATVTINVTPENAPGANPDSYVVGAGSTVRGNALLNDTDADGDPLSITATIAAPQHGSLSLNPDGSFSYTPGPTFTGSDSFQYEVSDDTNRTAIGTATITAAGFQAFEGVVTGGHADVGLNYEDGAWDLHIHDEPNDIEYEPGGAIYYVAPQALTTRAPGSEFDFIGVAAGEPYYRLPKNQNPELLLLGFGAEELEPGTFQSGYLDLDLKALNGPGQLSIWDSTDTGPHVLWTSSDGITAADTVRVLEGAHGDYNWGFSAKGRYELTVEAHGFLDDGDNIEDFSGDATYYFSVDNLGRIEFEKTNFGVTEANTTTVTVHRVGGSDGPATVSYATTPGTATIADYTPAAGDLVFADGETTKTFTFTTLKDKKKELVETAALSLSVPVGSAAQLGINDEATLSIDTVALLKVKKIVVNDGLKQRSNIETITISFTRDTNIAALIASGEISNAIQIFTRATQVALAPNRFFYDAAKNTVAIGLTNGLFDPDTKTILADGRYELRLNTALLTSAAGGVNLLDKDKTLDGVHRFAFHRLEGDFNGDKKVTKSDEGQLKKLLGRYFWQRSYNFAFDMTGAGSTPDGTIDSVDMTYLKTLFGRTV
ncbi:MAG: tandem-95 repeat protein [Gemmataceae bacterium]|nr:tandem-95 repeat protein [Gemmataceae bacterium]